MHIRLLQRDDFPELHDIWEKFYKDEFEFPDFITHFLGAYIVRDSQSIISVGGIRTITEVIALTNKNRSVRDRVEALHTILHASRFITDRFNYDQLHAFIQEEEWFKHLQKVGFRPTKGKALVIDVKD